MSFAIVSKLMFKSRVYYRVFCHGIAKWEDCKVVIYNYVLCWLYSITKSVVFALILFIVFFWDLFVMGLVLSGGDLIKTAKSHMRSTCQKLKSHARLSILQVFRG